MAVDWEKQWRAGGGGRGGEEGRKGQMEKRRAKREKRERETVTERRAKREEGQAEGSIDSKESPSPRREVFTRPLSLTGSPQRARGGVRGHRAARRHGRRGGDGGAEGRGHFVVRQIRR